MSFTIEITPKDGNQFLINLTSPPYYVHVGEDGSLMTLNPMKDGEMLTLPIYNIKRSERGTLILNEFTTNGNHGRNKPTENEIISVEFL